MEQSSLVTQQKVPFVQLHYRKSTPNVRDITKKIRWVIRLCLPMLRKRNMLGKK